MREERGELEAERERAHTLPTRRADLGVGAGLAGLGWLIVVATAAGWFLTGGPGQMMVPVLVMWADSLSRPVIYALLAGSFVVSILFPISGLLLAFLGGRRIGPSQGWVARTIVFAVLVPLVGILLAIWPLRAAFVGGPVWIDTLLLGVGRGWVVLGVPTALVLFAFVFGQGTREGSNERDEPDEGETPPQAS